MTSKACLMLATIATATPALASVDHSPKPGGVYGLKPGIFVQQSVGIETTRPGSDPSTSMVNLRYRTEVLSFTGCPISVLSASATLRFKAVAGNQYMTTEDIWPAQPEC